MTPTGLNRCRLLAHLGLMRELVRGMCIDWGVSIRGACGALQFDTSTFHSTSRRTDQATVARRIRRSARDEPTRRHRSEPDGDWCALWLSVRACPAAPGGVDDHHQEGFTLNWPCRSGTRTRSGGSKVGEQRINPKESRYGRGKTGGRFRALSRSCRFFRKA